MRSAKPITVSLGDLQKRVDARVKSGAYSSVDDVLRAGLRALDREEASRDQMMREAVQAALDDPRPDIPAEDVFAQLHAKHAIRMKAGRDL